MSNYSPEQEAFKHNDKVDDALRQEETSEALHKEVYPGAMAEKAGFVKGDKVEENAEKSGESSSEAAEFAARMAGISEKAARLPEEFRTQVVANMSDFIHPALLAVVKNPSDFKLSESQNPEDVTSLLVRMQKTVG